MIDFLGSEIRIGDTICWPVRRASKLWMCKGDVCDIAGDHIAVIKSDTGRCVKIKNLNTTVTMGATV